MLPKEDEEALDKILAILDKLDRPAKLRILEDLGYIYQDLQVSFKGDCKNEKIQKQALEYMKKLEEDGNELTADERRMV